MCTIVQKANTSYDLTPIYQPVKFLPFLQLQAAVKQYITTNRMTKRDYHTNICTWPLTKLVFKASCHFFYLKNELQTKLSLMEKT